jgi:hypothetical protein
MPQLSQERTHTASLNCEGSSLRNKSLAITDCEVKASACYALRQTVCHTRETFWYPSQLTDGLISLGPEEGVSLLSPKVLEGAAIRVIAWMKATDKSITNEQ